MQRDENQAAEAASKETSVRPIMTGLERVKVDRLLGEQKILVVVRGFTSCTRPPPPTRCIDIVKMDNYSLDPSSQEDEDEQGKEKNTKKESKKRKEEKYKENKSSNRVEPK